jgi:hypothetical protein
VFARVMCNGQRFAGGSNPRTRKSVDMDSFAAAWLRSISRDTEIRKIDLIRVRRSLQKRGEPDTLSLNAPSF